MRKLTRIGIEETKLLLKDGKSAPLFRNRPIQYRPPVPVGKHRQGFRVRRA